MRILDLLLRGIIAGLAISIPVGPVNVLCVSRTLAKGRLSGILSGLGAATADTIYGAIAGYSISFVISFLIREVSRIRFYGGILLIAIGISYYFKKAQIIQKYGDGKPSRADFVSAFLLNLTNPTTVLSFLAVLAGLHMSGERDWWLTLFLVLGIFTGAMLWWITLALLANHFRDRFNGRAMLWMNRIAGLAIGAFGIITLILSRA
jgi:threonine/homoserine/homoserine lactone efflux protein